jgi:hypothetical protein
MRLLHIPANVAPVIADAVWNKLQDLRDCVRIGQLATTEDDVKFLLQILDRRWGQECVNGTMVSLISNIQKSNPSISIMTLLNNINGTIATCWHTSKITSGISILR